MKHFVKCFPSKLIAGLVLSASMALTTSVSANEAGNWYIQGSAGLTTLENVEADRTTSAGATSTTVPFEADFKHGHMASAGLGYNLTDTWSVEVEYAHRSNDLDRYYNKTNNSVLSSNGYMKSNSFMVNGIYTFDVDFPVKPVVGFGFGVGHAEIEIVETSGTKDDDDYSYAGQLIVGADWEVTSNIDLFARANYFQIRDLDLEPRYSTTAGSFNLAETTTDKENYSSASISIGLRYEF